MCETVDALGYKADVKSRAKDQRSVDTSRTAGRRRARRTAATSRTRRAQARGVAQENPLGLAIGAVAVGFVAGMLIPSTRVEDEKFGSVADDVKERSRRPARRRSSTASRSRRTRRRARRRRSRSSGQRARAGAQGQRAAERPGRRRAPPVHGSLMRRGADPATDGRGPRRPCNSRRDRVDCWT